MHIWCAGHRNEARQHRQRHLVGALHPIALRCSPLRSALFGSLQLFAFPLCSAGSSAPTGALTCPPAVPPARLRPRSPKPAAPKPETRNPKPETRHPAPQVGCTIIELMTGEPPRFGLNPHAAMYRIVQARALSTLCPLCVRSVSALRPLCVRSTSALPAPLPPAPLAACASCRLACASAALLAPCSLAARSNARLVLLSDPTHERAERTERTERSESARERFRTTESQPSRTPVSFGCACARFGSRTRAGRRCRKESPTR